MVRIDFVAVIGRGRHVCTRFGVGSMIGRVATLILMVKPFGEQSVEDRARARSGIVVARIAVRLMFLHRQPVHVHRTQELLVVAVLLIVSWSDSYAVKVHFKVGSLSSELTVYNDISDRNPIISYTYTSINVRMTRTVAPLVLDIRR